MTLSRTSLVLGASLLASACGSLPDAPSRHANLNSTLWMQTAAEYQANSIQTYRSALPWVEHALADTRWSAALEQAESAQSLPPAIVLDIDETVLDNSPFQAKMVKANSGFLPSIWDDWVAQQSARAVPGAVNFLNRVQQLGVTVIYLSNRECLARQGNSDTCPQKHDTAENLRKVGINNVSEERILLKHQRPEWTSEKQSRRQQVTQSYRVIMLFGDDLGDFLPAVKHDITPAQRANLVEQYQQNWGTKWFVLANPTYGSWSSILQKPKTSYLRDF